MDLERAVKRWVLVATALLGSVIVVAVAAGPETDAGGVSRPAGVSAYSHEELQRGADMTQRMSVPNADTGSSNHRADEQLARSGRAGYVGALEQHQAEIDRMLGRRTGG